MNTPYEELKKQFPGTIKEGEILAPYTTYKIGGPADLFYIATHSDDLIKICIAAKTLGIPFFVLGGGSNVLISDKGFRGLVIKNNTSGITMKGMTGKSKGEHQEQLVYLEVDSGVPFNRLVRYTVEEGLSGLEMHLGLPGSVGGAIYMNSKWTKPAGAVGDAVYQAVVLTPNNEIKQVDKEYFNFSYGKSSLQKNGDTLIRVVFILKKDDKDALWNRANDSITYRRQSQPQGVRTAGCIFKNLSPSDALSFGTPDHQTSAGYLLDKAGCKGMKVGGAEVSTHHANFVITNAGATAADVIELIDRMKKNVKKKFGVLLKEEILLIGDFSS